VVFTVVAYSQSNDSAALTEIAALADQHATVVGDDIFVPDELPNLAGYYFLGANFTQGQISSPSLRRKTLIDVEPADVAALPASPPAFHSRTAQPIPLEPGEAIRTLMAEDAAGASRVTAALWFSDGPIEPVAGEIFTVRATNTDTLTANAWTAGALTFSQTLPAGDFEVVGARAQSTNLQLLLFPGGTWRPGGIGANADGNLDPVGQRYGGWGVWGRFNHRSPPQVEFLANGADSSQVVHLDLRFAAS
jgi:hypothetical protein